MIFDATVGGSSSNSFITREEATDVAPVVLSSPDFLVFDASSDSEKELALMKSTRMIDRSFEWNGSKYFSDQALSWPRHGVWIDGIEVGYLEIPKPIIDATTILAARILSGYTESQNLGSQPSKVKVGPIEVSMLESKTVPRSTLPEDVLSILSEVGAYQGSSSGFRTVQLQRS